MPLIIRNHIAYKRAPIEIRHVAPAVAPQSPRPAQRNVPWQKDELELMARLYRIVGPKVLAARFGRTPHAVWNKAQEIGLKGPGRGRRASEFSTAP